jgi:hypothetical protein
MIPKNDSKHNNMNADIIDAAMCIAEYEAGIQGYWGEEVNMFKDAEARMLKDYPKGKNNMVIPIKEPNTILPSV